jgi:hypothetical protein
MLVDEAFSHAAGLLLTTIRFVHLDARTGGFAEVFTNEAETLPRYENRSTSLPLCRKLPRGTSAHSPSIVLPEIVPRKTLVN